MKTMAERWDEFQAACLDPKESDPEVRVVMRDLFYCGAIAAIESLADGRSVGEVFDELEAYKPGVFT